MPFFSHIRHAALLSLATLLLVGCVSGGGGATPAVETLDFAPALEIDFGRMTRDRSGVFYQDLTVGDGPEARRERRVTVHYSGWLHGGRRFESSRDSGSPVSFTLGRGEVIRGWESGIQGMRAGGTRKLVVPPSLAYGSRGRGEAIPGNATLVFVVELLEVEW